MPDNWDFSTNRRDEAQSPPIITYGLCGICVLLTAAHWYAQQSMGAGTFIAQIDRTVLPSPAQIWDGAYYGLLTSCFVHLDLMHIIFNMLWLVQLGRVMEKSLSPWLYILFMAAAGGVSMGCELAISGRPGAGASGVVYAMFGLMWVGRARYRDWQEVATRHNLNIFLIWGVFCVFGTWAGFMHVANVAHGSGLLFGLCIGWLLLAPRRTMIWTVPLVLLVILTGLSLFWLPWNAEWNYYRAGMAFKQKQYRAAIEWYHRSLRLGGDRYLCWENISRAWGNLAYEAARRQDVAAVKEAVHQEESAKQLEGPDPETVQETSGPESGGSSSRKR